jgi:carboxypeptidase family protein
MRSALVITLLLTLAIPLGVRSQAAPARAVQSSSRPVLSGRVTDAVSGAPVPSASVDVRSANAEFVRLSTTADDSGRFSVQLPRDGAVVVTVRRLGYRAQTKPVMAIGDTSITIALVSVAQPLGPVVIEERGAEDVLSELRRGFPDHTRVFEGQDLAHTGQLLTGAFLLGQGGIMRVPCQRSGGFLPPGKVRSVPVEHEPADIWWPCALVRGKPVSVIVSVDGGPAQEFAWISSRELSEFAMIAVTHGQAVRAYTRKYIEAKTHSK